MKVVLGSKVQDQLDKLLMNASPEEVEELQRTLDEFKKMAEDGTLIENSEPVDFEVLREEDPELAAELWQRLKDVEGEV